MTWPRVDGMRALELGTPGPLRDALNALVLTGRKRATAGLLSEYEEEDEELEHVGEQLALLDNDGQSIATIQIRQVDVLPFESVPWDFATAEGEGDADLDEWRTSHERYWAATGTRVGGETLVVCLRFDVT